MNDPGLAMFGGREKILAYVNGNPDLYVMAKRVSNGTVTPASFAYYCDTSRQFPCIVIYSLSRM